MARSSALDLAWDADLGRLVRVRPSGIEDWLLARKFVVAFSAVGSLSAFFLGLVIPPFNDTGFAGAYAILALAAAGLALMVAGRAATVMRFETGPRFLDIPRLSRALWLACLLVLPCLVLQIVYPLKIVIGHRQLTSSDVKPVADLVRLYDELDNNTRISFPTIKDQGEPSVDAAAAQDILEMQTSRTLTLGAEVNAAYDATKSLLSRYPDLIGKPDFDAEQKQLNVVSKKRIDVLSGMSGQSISQTYKSKQELVKEKVKEWRKQGEQGAYLGYLETNYATQLGVSDKLYRQDFPGTNLSCRQTDESLGCQLLYRLDALSQLRERSFGAGLFDSFGKPPVPIPTFGNLFGVPLYILLFGWKGVMPILVIALTFGILVRIQRLTDIQWPYVTAAIGIIGIVIFVGFPPTKATPSSFLIILRMLEIPFAGLLLLPAWLLVMLTMAVGYEETAGTHKVSTKGVYVRLSMLAVPTIPFLLLSGWERPASLSWLIWLLAVMAFAGSGALIPWLDRFMLEANCRPRVA
jgi:hypothetical protein